MSIYDALKKRYAPPAWGLLFEVANATGGRITNYADALAMSLWPSRGLELHGFEIKTDRRDWLRELDDPKKSAAVQSYCDRWWLVTTKDVVHKADQLPPNWGHLELAGGRLFERKEAPPLEPKPLDRKFLAAIFRRLAEAQTNWIARDSLQGELKAEYDRGFACSEATAARKVEAAERDRDQLRRDVNDFERASGLKIARWDGHRVGAAVELVLRGGQESMLRDLRNLRRTAEHVRSEIDRALADYETGKERERAEAAEAPGAAILHLAT